MEFMKLNQNSELKTESMKISKFVVAVTAVVRNISSPFEASSRSFSFIFITHHGRKDFLYSYLVADEKLSDFL